MPTRRFLFVAFVCVVLPHLADAQVVEPASSDTTAADSVQVRLPEITVQAARSAETEASAPFAVTLQNRSAQERAFTPGTSLDDVLRPLAGLWVNDRHHFALGERISIRGVGYRANFGVRGVQVVYDGVPLTLPDGQAFLDVVDPAVLRSVELIRSPASAFWGNGSGGVLFLSSRPADPSSSVRLRVQGGSFGQQQGLLETSGTIEDWTLHGYLSGNRQDGFRDHSEGYRLRSGLNASRALSANTLLRLTAAGDVQETENPSSLTLEQFQSAPTQARPLFEEFNAGKESQQAQVGLSVNHDLGGTTLSGSAHYVYRSLENPLPFGYITYGRNSGGVRVSIRRTEGRVEGGAGIDTGIQRDDRVEFSVTQNGAKGDSITLNQLETVANGAAFGYVRYNATDQLAVSGGLRLDGVRFEANDRLLDDGDDSGRRTFSAWSPSIGLSYNLEKVLPKEVANALVFAHYSTAFDTPTASELSNRPDPTQGGFNQTLQPQYTQGLEIGTRGLLPAARLQFDLALYQLQVDNLITSQRLQSGYQFFENLGENTQRGLEASLTWTPRLPFEVAARYTGTRFTIDKPDVLDGVSLDGNRVPGIPAHRGYMHLQAERYGLWGRLSAEGVPSYFVNDANTADTPGYVLIDVRLGHRGLEWQDLTLSPFLTIDNLLNERYAASVVVNGGGEFYEPGPSRSFTAGLNVEL